MNEKKSKWSIGFKVFVTVVATAATIAGLTITVTSIVYAKGEARAKYETKVDMVIERVDKAIEPDVKSNTKDVTTLKADMATMKTIVKRTDQNVLILLRNGGHNPWSPGEDSE